MDPGRWWSKRHTQQALALAMVPPPFFSLMVEGETPPKRPGGPTRKLPIFEFL